MNHAKVTIGIVVGAVLLLLAGIGIDKYAITTLQNVPGHAQEPYATPAPTCTFYLKTKIIDSDGNQLPSSISNKSIWKLLTDKQLQRGEMNSSFSFVPGGPQAVIEAANNNLLFKCDNPADINNPQNRCDPSLKADYKQGEKASFFLTTPSNYTIVKRHIDRCGDKKNRLDYECSTKDIGSTDGTVKKGAPNEIPGLPIYCNMEFEISYFVKKTAPDPAPTPSCIAGNTSIMNKLRCGGLVIYFRHAQTDWSQNDRELKWASVLKDPSNSKLADFFGNCNEQRLLIDAGRSQAQVIGQSMRQNGIPIGQVVTNPWCRTQETARIAFGKAVVAKDKLYDTGYLQPDSAVRKGYKSSLEKLFSTKPDAGTNTIIVGAMPQLYDVTGISLEQGQSIVMEPNNGSYTMLTNIINSDDWQTGNLTPRSRKTAPQINMTSKHAGSSNLQYTDIVAHFGEKGDTISSDLNHDGVVDALDLLFFLSSQPN